MPRERRKSFGRTWGVTIVFVVLLVGLVIVTVTLVNQPLGRPIATPGPSAIVGTGETEFTPNGIAYASSHQFASVNLTTRPIPASKLGLGADTSATIPANQLGGTTLRLIDGRENVTLHEVGAITLASTRSKLSTLTFSADDLTVSEVHRRLLGDVTDLGLDSTTLVPLDAAIASAGRAGHGYSTTLPATTMLGAPIVTRVACRAAGSCDITYTAQLTAP